MITRENARHIFATTQFLLALEEGNRTRDEILHFLGTEVFDGGYITAWVIRLEDGYTAQQASLMHAHAYELFAEFERVIPRGLLVQAGVMHSSEPVALDLCGRLCLRYGLNSALLWLNHHELRKVVVFVNHIARAMAYLNEPGCEVLRSCPDYRPHLHAPEGFPEHSLWCITGNDSRRPGASIVDWAADEQDANVRISQMQKYPNRFSCLAAKAYEPAQSECEMLA